MSRARVRWIAGPVLRAEADGPFVLREAVRVGAAGLLGEVVRLDGHEILVQVYEDTAGLRPGTEIVGDGQPLSIRVGPGLLGRIFDGLLRPLVVSDVPWMQAGLATGARRILAFTPGIEVGEAIAAGQAFGRVLGDAARDQDVLIPPNVSGTATWVRAAGPCAEDEVACRVKDAAGDEHAVALEHPWPVRVPRPVRERLPSRAPLVTGQRVLDSLFPVALGGKAAIPGGFGTGKTVLLEALAKGCHADVIVYLGCGERGNEMAGVLEEFPRLEDPRTGRALMERTVVIANTSNMPVAAREASIYCAITVAEYFRDQGLDVALMADSTSRWAEALREVSGRFGELPGEGGYPAYLSSRLAEFYERAAHVRTLGGREGSVTVLGAISPPSGDFSEPVTSHTKRYVRSFWALDVRRAQARFYPAVSPLASYAEDAEEFAPWWSGQGATRWLELRQKFLTLLEDQSRLERMARIIGKDALPPRQQLTLLAADLVNEAFLRQSAFSPLDRTCNPQRQARMMELVARFIELAEPAVASGVAPARIQAMACWRPLVRMGEEIGEDEPERFAALDAAMGAEFHAFERERSEVPGEANEAAAAG